MAEQQSCAIEFCVWLGKSGSETLQLIYQTYGDDAMRRAAVLKWWKRFRDGETNVKNEPCSQAKHSACSTIFLTLAANGLQHLFEKWLERCKKCIACQGRYVEKKPPPHLHKVVTQSNKVSPRTFQTALVQ
jgi:hypothetical protein